MNVKLSVRFRNRHLRSEYYQEHLTVVVKNEEELLSKLKEQVWLYDNRLTKDPYEKNKYFISEFVEIEVENIDE